MNTSFLNPVEEHAIAHLVLHSPSCIGRKIQIHTEKEATIEDIKALSDLVVKGADVSEKLKEINGKLKVVK